MQIPRLLLKKHERKKLTIELRPETARTKTLFQRYTKFRRIEEWTSIKEELIEREGNRCHICSENNSHLHLHEFWQFDDKAQIMKLQDIKHVCSMCQKLKRTDFWFFTDYGKEQLSQLDICWEDLIKHYCKVNNCSLKEFGENWTEAVAEWKARNKIEWVNDYGEFIP